MHPGAPEDGAGVTTDKEVDGSICGTHCGSVCDWPYTHTGRPLSHVALLLMVSTV